MSQCPNCGCQIESPLGDGRIIHDSRACGRFVALDCFPSGIELEVCQDISARQEKGVTKYGVTVANNPLELKAWLQHAYEETLDKAIYLKRSIREMENI